MYYHSTACVCMSVCVGLCMFPCGGDMSAVGRLSVWCVCMCDSGCVCVYLLAGVDWKGAWVPDLYCEYL